MGGEQELAGRVAELEREVHRLRMIILSVGALVELVDREHVGPAASIEPRGERDGVFDSEDVPGFDRQVTQHV